MRRKLRTLRRALAVTVLLAFTTWMAVDRLTSSPPWPNPNGYDDFVKAGQMVTTSLDRRRDLGDYRELGLQDLREFASTNAEALKIARGALDRRCCMPLKNSQDWFRAHLGEMLSFKHLTFVFCLQGRLAQLEGRTNEAVNIYLDLIRFAHESTRGGMITDSSIARTLEALGMEGLLGVQDSLDAAQNRRIAKVLEELDTRSESWGNFLRRDVRYEMLAEFKSIFSSDSWQLRQRFKARFYQAERRRRHIMLDFAVRAYELETGEKPKSLTNLVPAYLKAVPRDPLTATNLVL